jgi:predicted Ser/Thr protein kinase
MSQHSRSSTSQAWEPPDLESLQALLPQYRWVACIGRGGMGAVYQAIQQSLNRPVAIKVLPGELRSDVEANFAERFRQEALTLASLTHPGIVTVYEAGEAGGLLFLVMEFVDGTDLARLLQTQGRLAPDRVVEVLGQVVEALHFAHERGVIHRDLKPANLLMTRDGRVKIADFGLAKRLDEPGMNLTRTNVAIGTSDFIAPEALVPELELDRRADVYGLGATLYQMLTGALPRGLWEAPSVVAGVDPRFDALIDRAMEPDRESRYQSAAELGRDLDRLRTPAVADEPPFPPPAPLPLPARPTERRWLRPAWLAGGGVLALALALTGWWWRPWEGIHPTGFHGPGVEFNGTNAFLRIRSDSRILTGKSTIEGWIRVPEARGQVQGFLISLAADRETRTWLGFRDSGEWWLGEGWIASDLPAPTPGWHHLAWVRDGQEIRAYRDGELALKRALTQRNPGPGAWLILGAGWGNPREFWTGSVGELRLWNLARSQRDIATYRSHPLSGQEPGLHAWYRFDEGRGTLAVNGAPTGAAFDAELINGVGWLDADADSTRPPGPSANGTGDQPGNPDSGTVPLLGRHLNDGSFESLVKAVERQPVPLRVPGVHPAPLSLGTGWTISSTDYGGLLAAPHHGQVLADADGSVCLFSDLGTTTATFAKLLSDSYPAVSEGDVFQWSFALNAHESGPHAKLSLNFGNGPVLVGTGTPTDGGIATFETISGSYTATAADAVGGQLSLILTAHPQGPVYVDHVRLKVTPAVGHRPIPGRPQPARP